MVSGAARPYCAIVGIELKRPDEPEIADRSPARSSSATSPDDVSLSQLKFTHDGLEREFENFNWLEGRVCTMCAPGDQRKSRDNQCEHAEPSASASAADKCVERARSVWKAGDCRSRSCRSSIYGKRIVHRPLLAQSGRSALQLACRIGSAQRCHPDDARHLLRRVVEHVWHDAGEAETIARLQHMGLVVEPQT
jgi:hypothetical protein